MVKYACMWKRVQLKSTLQHTGTWLAAAWQTRRLYYRPAVFFPHFRLFPFSFPPQKNSAHVSKLLLYNFFYFFKNWVHLKLRSLNCVTTTYNKTTTLSFHIPSISVFTKITMRFYAIQWGTRWCSWLRPCAESRKVAGSIAKSVIEIFHRQSTRNNSWGVKTAGL